MQQKKLRKKQIAGCKKLKSDVQLCYNIPNGFGGRRL
jgi:hypothetical protein